MKVLVAFYSRTGRTRSAAQLVSGILDAEVEEIIDRSDRKGLMGYIRSGLDGFTRNHSRIVKPRKDPSDYDLLVIGTPIWAGRISSPVRSYLKEFRDRLPPVVLFCTTGGTKSEEAESDLLSAIGKRPLGSICIKEEEAGDERTAVNLRIFFDGIIERIVG